MKSKIKVNIRGRVVNRFIKRLIKNKIEILSLNYISKNEVNIIVFFKDYEKVEQLKSIYEINIVSVYGFLKLKKIITFNIHIIILCLLCFIIFKLLTNMIFSIEVIHSNKNIRNIVTNELKKEGISKYHFKKDYDSLEKIKQNILKRHKKDIEWLEIEEVGTKYTVRVEQRLLRSLKTNNKARNIIAKKDAVIKNVKSSKGVIIRNTNDFVKKGNIIISGEITLNEKVMDKVRASGKVYGEVWYIVHTKYPFAYYNEKETGREKKSYVLKFLNHNIELSFYKYKHKKTKDKIIYKSKYIPLSLSLQKQKEIKVKSEILTFDEAKEKAIELAREKIKNTLKEDEYIISSKYLKSTVKEGTIETENFFAVYENITDYSSINSE